LLASLSLKIALNLWGIVMPELITATEFYIASLSPFALFWTLTYA
jgi:hypothetical protein